MSRSRRKHPYTGITTCRSEKDDKREAHRRFRHAVHQRLNTDAPDASAADETPTLPHWREYSDPWDWGKDGKMYYAAASPHTERMMRK